MAFLDSLSRTQRILLAIVCFPLVPFYLCYRCCCVGEDDDKETEGSRESKPRQAEEGRAQPIDTHTDGAAVAVHPQTRTRSLSGGRPVQKGVVQRDTDHKAGEVRAEVYPQEEGVRLSFGKGIITEKPEAVYDNKGFVGDHNVKDNSNRTPATGNVQPKTNMDGVAISKGNNTKKAEAAYENKGFVDNHVNKQEKGATGHAYPWDESSLKSAFIDLKKFQELDARASKVIARGNTATLVQDLLKGLNSEIERLRAIWIWVTHHVEYDVEGFHNLNQRDCSPDAVLRTGKGVCAGYAGLFKQMCSFAGIECVEVSGYSKGYSYKPGSRFTGSSDHAWNAIKLFGTWHLLDSTWGAGYVNDTCSQFNFEYKEYYFLTHPALFVGNHFPMESQWQLLNTPISLKQFEDALNLKSSFYSCGLISVQPSTTSINSDGKTTVTMKASSPTLFMHDLDGDDKQGILMLTPEGMKLEVYPPRAGKYLLNVYARPADSGKEHYDHVCKFQLQCQAVNKQMRFPDDLSNPVGPSWKSEKDGLQNPSHTEPIIYTTDGRCSFSFTSQLALLINLSTSSFSMTDDEQKRHTFLCRKGDNVDLKVQLPRAGLYQLRIFGKKKSAAGMYAYICNYLISCDNPSVRWPAFPLSYSTWEEGYELVEPLANDSRLHYVLNYRVER